MRQSTPTSPVPYTAFPSTQLFPATHRCTGPLLTGRALRIGPVPENCGAQSPAGGITSTPFRPFARRTFAQRRRRAHMWAEPSEGGMIMWLLKRKNTEMPTRESALPGRETRMKVPPAHFVLGTPLEPPFPDGMELALFGLGCFWGAERKFWEVPGVHSTAAGYAAGITPNPTYEAECSGMTGPNEVVRVVFAPQNTRSENLHPV